MDWQPIETAPKDGKEILVININQGNIFNLISWNTVHGYWQSKGVVFHFQETHWTPLPKPPAVDKVGTK